MGAEPGATAVQTSACSGDGPGRAHDAQNSSSGLNAAADAVKEPAGAMVRRQGGGAVTSATICRGGSGAKVAGGRGKALPPAVCAIAIHELNEEAIELIFTFLPPEDRGSAAAVCRLWRRVHNSSTKLWGSVLLSGERIVQAAASASAGTIAAWLGARLEAMRAVRLWSPCHPLEAFASGLAQLLGREGRLQAFSYAGADASVSQLLAVLPGLGTSLQLLDILAPALAGPGQGLVVRAKELAKLKPLRNLLSLQLHAREIRGSLPPALFRRLNRLQHLAITAKCRLPAAVVRQLTGLHSLELHGACMDEAAAEAAAALQQLTRLGFSVQGWGQGADAGPEGGPATGHGSASGGADGASGEQAGSSGRRRGGGSGKCAGGGATQSWQEHPIWGQLPLLARLQHLAVGAELPEPPGAAAGAEEGGTGLHGAAVLPFDLLEGSVPDGIMDCSSLTHLALPVALTALPDLVPGQLARLEQLDLTHCILEALPPSWCCNMQALRRLVLNGAQLAGSRLPAEFAALQGLRHLELRACRLEVLPSCVAQLRGLSFLDVGVNRLASLPPGPYLARLRCLVAHGNLLRALPHALAEAQALEVLDVGENDELVLHPSDVGDALAHMPALRHLVICRQPAGFGFGPYISAGSGASWDAQSVGVLMQLARTLPALNIHLERGAAFSSAGPYCSSVVSLPPGPPAGPSDA